MKFKFDFVFSLYAFMIGVLGVSVILNCLFLNQFSDFELADAQYEHALAVERLAPSLASLRIELCPEYMTENCFWRIYFVLVHPKLSKDHALLLSTPQVSLDSQLHCLQMSTYFLVFKFMPFTLYIVVTLCLMLIILF